MKAKAKLAAAREKMKTKAKAKIADATKKANLKAKKMIEQARMSILWWQYDAEKTFIRHMKRNTRLAIAQYASESARAGA